LPAYRFSGAKLRAAREARNASRDELARRIGRSESLITLIELDYKRPTPEKLCELAVALDVPIESFFVEVDEVPA
jgi:transcriptional regulator with XRE-family HTH domain